MQNDNENKNKNENKTNVNQHYECNEFIKKIANNVYKQLWMDLS